MIAADATRQPATDLGRKASRLAAHCRKHPTDQEAWGELVAVMERVVGYRAGRLLHPNPRYDEDDLRQEGYMGVMRAVRDYDTRWEFGTHALPWIVQHMQRCRDRVAHPAHIPVYVLQRVRRWQKAGQPPDAEAERTYAGMLPDRDAGKALDDAHAGDDPAEVAGTRDDIARLAWAVEELRRQSPREAEMFCRYHGILGRERANYREIGEEHGVFRARVRQVVEDAGRRVKAMLTGAEVAA